MKMREQNLNFLTISVELELLGLLIVTQMILLIIKTPHLQIIELMFVTLSQELMVMVLLLRAGKTLVVILVSQRITGDACSPAKHSVRLKKLIIRGIIHLAL